MARAYDIALFIFIFNLSTGMVNTMNVFPGTSIAQDTNIIIPFDRATPVNETNSLFSFVFNNPVVQSALQFQTFVFGNIGQGIVTFINTLRSATMAGSFITKLGAPPFIGNALDLMTGLVYIYMLAQVVSGRTGKSMQ